MKFYRLISNSFLQICMVDRPLSLYSCLSEGSLVNILQLFHKLLICPERPFQMQIHLEMKHFYLGCSMEGEWATQHTNQIRIFPYVRRKLYISTNCDNLATKYKHAITSKMAKPL